MGRSLAHVGPDDHVAFASEPLHAARARRYARARRPDLAARLVVADHRPLEGWWDLAWSAPYEAWCWLLDARAARRSSASPTGWSPRAGPPVAPLSPR